MSGARQSIARHMRLAILWTVLFGGTAAAWSIVAPLDEAVVAVGTVTVESSVKKVQHPTGGVIGEILVHEGAHVKSGDLLLRLDETTPRANLGVIINELTSLRLRQARLVAERTGADQLTVPVDIETRSASDATVKLSIEQERQLHLSRIATGNGQKLQIKERINQLRQEISGMEKQRDATVNQIKLSVDEHDGLRGLEEQGLVHKPRMNSLRRDIARNEGMLGDLTAKIASAQGKITESELQILQLDKDHAAEVTQELRDVETKIGEFNEKRINAEDQLRRVEVRAPISGAVHQLQVHTIGGVVSSSDILMLLVPEADRLIVEARVNPQDIDQVFVGQPTRIRFSAFNQRTTPEVEGRLFRIGSDLVREEHSGHSYFTVAAEVTDAELAKLKNLKLKPGMPAEVFVKTGSRTLASYLVKPMTDQFQRGLREQ